MSPGTERPWASPLASLVKVLPAVRLLSLTATLMLAGCGPGSDRAREASPGVRQVQLLDEPPLERVLPFDIDDRRALVSACSRTLFTLDADELADGGAVLFADMAAPLPLDELLAGTTGRLSGRGRGSALHLRPPETLLRSLEINDPGTLLVSTWVSGEEASVALLPRLPGPTAQGEDPAHGRADLGGFNPATLAEHLTLAGLPLTGSGDRGGCWLSTIVPADAARDGLLLVAVARFRPMTLGRTEVRRLTPLGAALLNPSLRPSSRQLMLGDEARQGLILPVGSRMRWQVTLPAEAPWLECDVAALAASSDLSIHWDITPTPDVEGASTPWQLSWSPALNGSGSRWSARQFELSAVAGQTLQLTLTIAGQAGAALIGRPRLVSHRAAPEPRRPDVLLVVLDTLRADRTTPGAPSSPRIQALAHDSVRFAQASSTSSWTLPAHASLFTGRWPQSHGVTDKFHRLDESAPRLSRAFADAGYETAAFTGGGFVAPLYGLSAGFERYSVVDPCALALDDQTAEPTRQVGSRVELKSLLSNRERRPLFLFIHTFAAHHGMPKPSELARFGLDPSDFAALRDVIAALTEARQAGEGQNQPPNEATIAQLRALYDASVLAVDDLVGDIVDTLVANGRFDDTILVVTSDHGQELFDRGSFGHGHQLHSELLDIPLIVHAPEAVSRVVDTPVSLVDLYPTLLELAGLAADQSAQGRSLVPLLNGGELPEGAQLAHLAYVPTRPTHHLRRGDSSLHMAEAADGSLSATALYDLGADPHERSDLLDAHPDAAAALLSEYAATLEALGPGTASAAGQLILDPQTRQRLVELGYLSGG